MIIDGMALIQKVNGDNQTFGDISKNVLRTALLSHSTSTRVDIVFDIYKTPYIKQSERNVQNANRGISFSSISAGHRIKNWRGLLNCSSSKEKLTHFFHKIGNRDET